LLPESGRDKPFDTALGPLPDFPKMPPAAEDFLDWSIKA